MGQTIKYEKLVKVSLRKLLNVFMESWELHDDYYLFIDLDYNWLSNDIILWVIISTSVEVSASDFLIYNHSTAIDFIFWIKACCWTYYYPDKKMS